MINYNGIIIPSTENSLYNNRAFLFGDGVFETLKILNNKILFFEDHYFRLMSAMRILRMEIPMNFTMEFLENEILQVVNVNNYANSSRVRFSIYRNQGGNYLPETNSVSYIISSTPLENQLYKINKNDYEVDLFKDYYISKQLIATIKSINKNINILASIYANENQLDNCLLVNENKNIVEAIQGNVFMLMNNKLITPPVSEGCLNGIMRKQILLLAKKTENLQVVEEVISPFDLQKADELFITNVIMGIQPITRYRKKEYNQNFSNELLEKLNELINIV